MKYTPDHKKCDHEYSDGVVCGVTFYPGNNMKEQNWRQARFCKKHRKKKRGEAGPSNIPGHYEVKSLVIDKFLRGTL